MYEEIAEVFNGVENSLHEKILSEKEESAMSAEQYKEIKETFEYFDQAKDHFLNEKEFRDCVQGMGLPMTDDEIVEAFKKLDVSGDSRVTFEEFSAFMIDQKQTGTSQEDIESAFATLANGDDLKASQVPA